MNNLDLYHQEGDGSKVRDIDLMLKVYRPLNNFIPVVRNKIYWLDMDED